MNRPLLFFAYTRYLLPQWELVQILRLIRNSKRDHSTLNRYERQQSYETHVRHFLQMYLLRVSGFAWP